MTRSSARALALLAAALFLGVTADSLRTWVPGQLDLALWVAAALLSATALVRSGAVPAPPQAPWLGASACLLLPCLIWRDADALLLLDLLGLLGLTVLAVPATAWQALGRLGAFDIVRGAVALGLETVAGPISALARDVSWSDLPVGARTRRATPVLVGLVAALPVILLFGALFGEADPLFQQTMSRLFRFDLANLAGHLAFAGLVTWGSAGALRGTLWREGRSAAFPPATPAGGQVPAGVVLGFVGGIGALFAVFVGFQARELFLDSAAFQALTGVTISEYARRGFFELLAVAVLTLPLLLGGDWLMSRREGGAAPWFHRVTLAVLVLLGFVLASACQRMLLYRDYYGLTEQRFYALVFMAYLAGLLGWFAATVLRGRRSRFVPGALAGGYAALLVLNVVSPDAVVARVNLRRTVEGAPLDAAYLGRLSADAVPTLLEALPGLPLPERCMLEAQMRQRWQEADTATGAGDWNLSRVRAARRWASAPAGPACPSDGA